MENAQLSCKVYDGLTTVRSAEVSVGTIRATPTNLRMVNAPTQAMRNVEITFTCESDGAKPASAYNYKVLQDDRLVASTNSYTPPIDSTGNITLKCEDNIHPNLSRNVLLTNNIPLYYLDPPQSTERTVSLNPNSAGLTCDVGGYPVTYTWTCDDCTSADSSKDWILTGFRASGQMETIICTAFVDSLPSVNIAWTVTWDEKASTPSLTATLPTATNTVKAGADLVVVAVAVVVPVVTVLIAAVIVYLCMKKKAAQKHPVQNAQVETQMTGNRNMSSVNDNYTSLAQSRENHPYDTILQQPHYENIHTPEHTQVSVLTPNESLRSELEMELRGNQTVGDGREGYILFCETEDHPYDEIAQHVSSE